MTDTHHRRLRRILGPAGLTLVAALTVVPGAPTAAGTPVASVATADDAPSTQAADCGPFTPAVSQVYFNDPRQEGANNIQDLMECRIGQTPRGETIRVATLNLDDPTLGSALAAAHRRGVDVKVAVAFSKCGDVARRLKSELADRSGTRGDRSGLRCVTRSGRTDDGVMHLKTMTITRSGGARDLVLVGSANMTREAYADQWNDTFQYVNRSDIRGWYDQIFRQVFADRELGGNPYFERTAGAARVQFTPVRPGSPGADPAWRRIDGLQPGARVRLAMYAWPGSARGLWMRDVIVRRSANVDFNIAVGPATSSTIVRSLRRNGIPVTRIADDGCTRDNHVKGTPCNYTHTKFMTADYVIGGKREHRTWTGSDNFVDLKSTEVIQRIGGQRIHDRYVGVFQRMVGAY